MKWGADLPGWEHAINTTINHCYGGIMIGVIITIIVVVVVGVVGIYIFNSNTSSLSLSYENLKSMGGTKAIRLNPSVC